MVLYFYNQDGSPGCSLEAQRFQQGLPKFEEANATVLGVSMDSVESHEGFCDEKGITFPLLSDEDGSVSREYGAALSIPVFGKFSDRQTFLIDSTGKVRGHWLERDGSMASVKTPEHVNQILDALKEL